MTLTLDDLFASPDHYLHSFDGDSAIFVPMDRAAYHRSIFLDDRISAAGKGSMRLPLQMLTDAPRPPVATGWIFHLAHCGSTLLARALDDVSANLVLREPLALRQTAFDPAPARIALVMAMTGKRYRDDLRTLVKANVPVNFILPELVAHDPAARAVLLHLDLRDYLLAILRSDNHRAWMRRITEQMSTHIGHLTGLGDAERAAALWLAQTRAFVRTLATMPGARVLDAEHFFTSPDTVLKASTRHLGIAITDEAIDATIRGPLFATYSKNPGLAFDNAARLERRAQVESTIADELAQAQAWIKRTTGEVSPEADTLARAALIR